VAEYLILIYEDNAAGEGTRCPTMDGLLPFGQASRERRQISACWRWGVVSDPNCHLDASDTDGGLAITDRALILTPEAPDDSRNHWSRCSGWSGDRVDVPAIQVSIDRPR
jgi:hypothetical protein